MVLIGMWDLGIIATLVATEGLDAGLNTLSKAAMRKGMSSFVFVVYQNALAVLFLLLLTIIFYRVRPPPPKLTFSILSKIFLLGLAGCCLQMCIFTGIGYSSPTLASAMNNLIPAFTFVLALITRMEKLELKAKSSNAKLMGTIASITGAFVVTSYKGPVIIFNPSPYVSLHQAFQSVLSDWVIGSFLLAAASFLLAVMYIVQSWIMKDYPSETMITLMCSGFVTIQSAIVALIAERDPKAWKLISNMELIAIGYAAIFVLGFKNTVIAWAVHKKGPVFVSMFKPIGLVIAVVMGVTFLRDSLYLGSVIGAAIIAVGFYSVVWGKAREEKIEDNEILYSSCEEVPLLQEKSMEV